MRTCLVALLAACTCGLAPAQPASCSSDGQTPPVVLYERFVNADCADCWSQTPTSHQPGPSALVLDWILPGGLGDEAPLSAAATRDALERLQILRRPVPTQTDTHVSTASSIRPALGTLRVAHGLPINNYLGTSITWTPTSTPRDAGPWRFTLLLVEAVPAQTEGTPVARLLVRNMLEGPWSPSARHRVQSPTLWHEMRPMRIADGAHADRLSVVGWVEDAQGQVLSLARSQCATQP